MNLAQQIEQCLPARVLELVRHINTQAADRGERAYLVGGIVRDVLLGIASVPSASGPGQRLHFDLDLAVEGDAVQLAQQVAATGLAKLLARHRFGTAKLRCGDFTLDVATARKETYARPGALPAVASGTLKDDLSRRDFSINAMAISLSAEDYGRMIDPHDGKSDLERHLIRILHPASFRDDATRILRGVRYEQRFGFDFETETARLLKANIAMLDTISGDRIRHELELILSEDRPELAIRRLAELGALQRLSPCLTGDGPIAERFASARRLARPGQLPWLYWCLLVYSFSEGEMAQLITRLNVPARASQGMRDTLRLKTRLDLLDHPALRPSAIYDLLHEYDPVSVQANAIAADSMRVRRHLQLFLTKLRSVRTSLNGDDLARLGIPPGPEMGRILQTLHRAGLDGQVSTRADEEKLALALSDAADRPGGQTT